MRTILVVMDDGSRRLVSKIPDDAKVTFGHIQPGKNVGFGTNALRIYTSQSNQLAVFVGVKEFRDQAIEVREQKRISKSKSVKDRSGSQYSEEMSVDWEDPEVL